MTYSSYGFTGAAGQDPSVQAGMNQYMQQGQMGINPGQAQVAASNPIGSVAQNNLAKALAASQQQKQLPAQVDPAQAALTNGALMQPNVNGQNMGGVGPTQNNADSMQAYANLPPDQSPTMAQRIGDYLSNMFGGGNNA
jgi:hypothetical protein